MDFNPEDKTVVGLTLGQKVFDRYELDRVLGQGAMGVVWLAQDMVMGEPVALKFLPQILAADPAALEEMKDEARHARRLTHEHIVRIHDMVTGGNLAAISMEYVDGYTLSALRLMKPNRILEVADLEPLLPQIGAGLDYAHQRAKVVHRDLKPSNLMVTRDGDLKITDFGIARSLTDTVTRLTKASTSGTPCYMSPQQMMGKRPDPKDDLYALGATLYELLTGKPPFYTGDLGMQVLHAEVVPVRERREELGIEGGEVPEVWEEVLSRCLSKDPEQRPDAASEVVLALGLEGVGSRPIGESEPQSASSSPAGTVGAARSTGGTQQSTLHDACPHCGEAVYADQQFCRHCGGGLTEPCPECSFSNPLKTRFCGQCGLDQESFHTLQGEVERGEAALQNGNLQALEDLPDPEPKFSGLRGEQAERLKARLGELKREGAVSAPPPLDAALSEHITGLIGKGKYKDARQLLLSPSLPEAEREGLEGRLREAIEAGYARVWDEAVDALSADDPERARSILENFILSLPTEEVPTDAKASLAGVEALESMVELARNGEWDSLREEQEALRKSALGAEEKRVFLEKTGDMIWNTVLERAQAKLKAGGAAEAYRILVGFEASGLGGDRIASLKPRMEAIREEANKPVLTALASLEGKQPTGDAEREELLERLEGCRRGFIPGSADADSFTSRLEGLKEKWNSLPVEAEPPPIPEASQRKEAAPKKPPESPRARSGAGREASERKENPRKGARPGLWLGIGVPLVLLLSVSGLFFFYSEGKKDLATIEALIEDGFTGLAEREFDQLSKNVAKSLFLKDELQRLRELLQSDQALVALYADYPGLKAAYSELKKRYPEAKIVEAPVSWDQFPGFLEGLPAGTLLLLSETEYRVTRPLVLEEAIGFVGAKGRSVLRVADPDALPVFTAKGEDVLLAGLDILSEGEWGSESAAPLVLVDGGDFRFHDLLADGPADAFAFRSARGRMEGSTLRNSLGTAVRVSGPGSEVKLSETTWTDCGIGLLVEREAVLLLEDAVVDGSGEVGIQALDSKTELTVNRTSLSGGNRGLSVADGALAKVEGITIETNRNAGLAVSGAGSKLILRGSESNGNGVGVEVSSGGRVQAFELEARANGGHGILVSGEGAFMEVDRGNFPENASNGATVMNGGTLVLKGVDSQMNESGVVASGRGTRLGLMDCVINENRADGVIVFSGARARLRDTHMLDNAMNGLKVFNPGSEVDARASHFESNGEDGVLVFMGAGGLFQGNRALKNGDSGFSLSEAATLVELFDNEILENGQHGIYLGAGAVGWIESNKATGNADAGILVGSPDTFARVIANEVSENAFGIVVQTQATGEVLENRSYRNENSGLGIFSAGTTALVSNNELRDNGTFGLDTNPESGVTLLQDNIYAGNASGPRK